MKERPRLLFVAPSAYPLGGVATWLDYLLPGLETKGWECELALASGVHHDHRDYLMRHPWPRSHALINATGTRQGRIRALLRVLENSAPDLVINAGLADLYSVLARPQCRQRWPRLRLVSTQHTLQHDFLDDLQRAWELVAAVICTNRLTQRVLRQRLDADRRVLYAAYGVKLGQEMPLGRAVDGVFRIGFAGRLEDSQKRVMDLAPILERVRAAMPMCELYIAGEGPSHRALRQVFGEHGLSAQVTWLGAVDPTRMQEAFYAKIDALLITSHWETGPIVAWEAMAAGVPVVASQYLGSYAEAALVHEDTALLYPLADTRAGAEQLLRVADEDGLRRGLVERAWSMVRARYSIDASVVAWDAALAEVWQQSTSPTLDSDPFALAPSGRLDRWFGPAGAETCRRLLGRRFVHREAGSEWPHAYGSAASDQAGFAQTLRELDRPAFGGREP